MGRIRYSGSHKQLLCLVRSVLLMAAKRGSSAFIDTHELPLDIVDSINESHIRQYPPRWGQAPPIEGSEEGLKRGGRS